MRALWSFFVLPSLILGCGEDVAPSADAPKESDPYAFFVAGHVYGKPGGDSMGLYPPFKARLPWITAQPGMRFGVLAGDIVRRPNARFWDPAAQDIAAIGLPIHQVAGNHDIAYEGAEGRDDLLFRGDYEERFGPTYFAWREGPDLFLVVDSTLDHWNLSGAQLAWLEEELARGASRNLFLFVHHLIWWREADRPNLRPNSWDGRSKGVPNFWSTVVPLLRGTGAEVFVIAGDLGATRKSTSFYCAVRDGVHLIATGMGAGLQDNCVVVRVGKDGVARPELVALDGEPDSLGPLCAGETR